VIVRFVDYGEIYDFLTSLFITHATQYIRFPNRIWY